MRPPSTEFDAWVGIARRLGLGPWVAFLLEALAPLSLLGSQATYILEPVLGPGSLRSLRRMLENRAMREDLGRRLLDRSQPDEVGGG